jgi:preprotein translocase subunit SecE
VARNRKRAKERRARRPAESALSVRTTRADRDEAPTPIAHAAPDVELAEAQLALGRDPELVAAAEEEAEGLPDDELDAQNGDLGDPEAMELETATGAGRGGGGGGGGTVAGRTSGPGGHGAVEPRAHLAARLIGFLQGCWHELQRVQWPDRRQVMQATGVVIGFVIVAGVFLGVADYIAQQIVKLVLK